MSIEKIGESMMKISNDIRELNNIFDSKLTSIIDSLNDIIDLYNKSIATQYKSMVEDSKFDSNYKELSQMDDAVRSKFSAIEKNIQEVKLQLGANNNFIQYINKDYAIIKDKMNSLDKLSTKINSILNMIGEM